jgi:hypothetical protein
VQTEKLAAKDNSFREVNQVRCFNHSIQLSTRALLRPFNTGLGSKIDITDKVDDSTEGTKQFATVAEDEDECPDIEDNDCGEDDSGEDEFEGMASAEHETLLADTTAVRETVTKVLFPLFCSSFLELC